MLRFLYVGLKEDLGLQGEGLRMVGIEAKDFIEGDLCGAVVSGKEVTLCEPEVHLNAVVLGFGIGGGGGG